MTLQELLSAQVDLASIAAALRRGLGWWRDELSALLPESLRDRLSSRPAEWIEPQPGGGWRVWRRGLATEIDARALIGAKGLGLLAPAEAVLVRELPGPRMLASDLKAMVALNVDRFSPLAPELIHFDVDVAENAADPEGRRVRLGVMRREDAAALLSEARADGFAPAALAVRDAEGAPRFDFLPQVRAANGEPRPGRTRLYLLAAAGALVALNVAALVVRDIVDTRRLEAAVEAQRPGADAVLRLRRRVQDEEQRRRALIARGAATDPLRLMYVLTVAVPRGAWVQHLEWNGETLRLVGFKRDEIDLAAALRGSGAFVNPRMPALPPTVGPTPVKPFDVTADARPPRRP